MRVVLIGDSIAQGLGVQGRSYGELVSDWIRACYTSDVTFMNFAQSGMQLYESKNRLGEIVDSDPSIVIIAHGITEAIIRPKDNALHVVPQRWRKPGWMDPRPYFSRRRLRRLGQIMESALRWRIKVLLIRMFGGMTWGDPSIFENDLQKFVSNVLNLTHARVLFLTHCGIDERYFPGSLQSLNIYAKKIYQVCDNFNSTRVKVCNVTNVCLKWDDFFSDHFHPNVNGHVRIAHEICKFIEPFLLMNTEFDARRTSDGDRNR